MAGDTIGLRNLTPEEREDLRRRLEERWGIRILAFAFLAWSFLCGLVGALVATWPW